MRLRGMKKGGKRILDLIDDMIEFRLYGADELLALGEK